MYSDSKFDIPWHQGDHSLLEIVQPGNYQDHSLIQLKLRDNN